MADGVNVESEPCYGYRGEGRHGYRRPHMSNLDSPSLGFEAKVRRGRPAGFEAWKTWENKFLTPDTEYNDPRRPQLENEQENAHNENNKKPESRKR